MSVLRSRREKGKPLGKIQAICTLRPILLLLDHKADAVVVTFVTPYGMSSISWLE